MQVSLGMKWHNLESMPFAFTKILYKHLSVFSGIIPHQWLYLDISREGGSKLTPCLIEVPGKIVKVSIRLLYYF